MQLITIVVALVVAVVASGGIALLVAKHQSPSSTAIASLRPSGIPASVSTSTAELMALSPVPKRLAPGFTLEDQYGKVSSLSSLRGKVVVLEFMDPHCVDICPLVSQEFVDAYHDLGKTADKVVFAAVNVNQYHSSPAAVLAFSKEHSLVTIPSWRFFTGATPALKKVWHDYNVAVEAPNPNADIIHSSLVYFIDPSGHERYLASPEVDHTASGKAFLPASQLSQWGQGIAKVARSLAG